MKEWLLSPGFFYQTITSIRLWLDMMVSEPCEDSDINIKVRSKCWDSNVTYWVLQMTVDDIIPESLISHWHSWRHFLILVSWQSLYMSYHNYKNEFRKYYIHVPGLSKCNCNYSEITYNTLQNKRRGSGQVKSSTIHT
jgi:hypothetical protein